MRLLLYTHHEEECRYVAVTTALSKINWLREGASTLTLSCKGCQSKSFLVRVTVYQALITVKQASQ
jgi:hypothetical protein